MPVTIDNNQMELSGQISIEDCEALYQWLLHHPKTCILLKDLTYLHTASWQLLQMFNPRVEQQGFVDPAVATWLLPLIQHEE